MHSAELRGDVRTDDLRELRVVVQETHHRLRRTEAAEALERGQRDGHLRLVVIVFVHARPACMQLLREDLIRVRLDGQGLADGEHLEEERQAPTTRVRLHAAEHIRVLDQELREGLTGRVHECLPTGVRAHPELSIRGVLIDLSAG